MPREAAHCPADRTTLDGAILARNTAHMPDDPSEIDADLTSQIADQIDSARTLVDEAEHVVVLTGAGISTDSGIPDFRGPEGVWTKNPEAEKMATLQHYMAEPELRVKAWQTRMAMADRANRPNIGHRALLALEQREKLHTIVTQNVDGLHHDAGQDPGRMVEIHGTMREVVCMACDDRQPMAPVLQRVLEGEGDPPCRECGGILKSATISFGQGLVAEDLQRAEEAAHLCDLMLAIGTTLGVFPIANMVPVAAESGASIVIVNAEPTQMDPLADVIVRGSISEVLPQILRADED